MPTRKGPGRPKVDVLELARLHFWYAAIRERVGNELLDVELDRRFLWPAFLPESVERSRVFERLRLSARLLHNERHDKLSRLLDVVDADPQCRGTKAFYDASFWYRIEEGKAGVDVVQASRDVSSALNHYRLQRVTSLPASLHTRMSDLSKVERYRRCLAIAIDNVPMLERAGFLWSLRRLTFHRDSTEIRDYLDSRLERIFEQMFAATLSSVERPMGTLNAVGISATDSMWSVSSSHRPPSSMTSAEDVQKNLALGQAYAHELFKRVRREVLIDEDIDSWPYILSEASSCILPTNESSDVL